MFFNNSDDSERCACGAKIKYSKLTGEPYAEGCTCGEDYEEPYYEDDRGHDPRC